MKSYEESNMSDAPTELVTVDLPPVKITSGPATAPAPVPDPDWFKK
jgi:hypothetical protein